MGAQFHPEFKSRPGKPSALFLGLVLAAAGKLDNWLSGNPLSPARPLKRSRPEGQGSSQAAKEPKQEPALGPLARSQAHADLRQDVSGLPAAMLLAGQAAEQWACAKCR